MALKEVKERIRSIRNTRKITSAMKMVSSAKLHKAQHTIENMLPYSESLHHVMSSLLSGEYTNSLSDQREVKRVAIVAFSSDGSLCGAFNTNVIRATLKTMALLIKYIFISLCKKNMNCPKCLCEESVRSGIIKEKQRYKCKNCGCNYTVEMKSTAKPKSMKKQALHLYLEGLGFRSIGRILGVSNVSVLNWIRDFGHKVQELSSQNQDIEMVELDEMHSYIGSKKLLLDMDCC